MTLLAMKYDLNGKTFGRLTVLSYVAGGKWICSCTCGKEKSFFSANLRSGRSQSCGCLNAELAAARNTLNKKTHGMSKTPEYKVWQGMRQRCENPHDHSFPDYGGRGIKVCESWQEFETFFREMGPRPRVGLSIERVDVNKDYGPTNCIWATAFEQNINKRKTVRLNGVPIAVLVGDSHSAEYQRLRKQVSVQR